MCTQLRVVRRVGLQCSHVSEQLYLVTGPRVGRLFAERKPYPRNYPIKGINIYVASARKGQSRKYWYVYCWRDWVMVHIHQPCEGATNRVNCIRPFSLEIKTFILKRARKHLRKVGLVDKLCCACGTLVLGRDGVFVSHMWSGSSPDQLYLASVPPIRHAQTTQLCAE